RRLLSGQQPLRTGLHNGAGLPLCPPDLGRGHHTTADPVWPATGPHWCSQAPFRLNWSLTVAIVRWRAQSAGHYHAVPDRRPPFRADRTATGTQAYGPCHERNDVPDMTWEDL